MKKMLLFIIAAMFIVPGCASVRESEWYKHGTHYKNTDHLKYSWFGYQTPTTESGKKSQEQGWWGKPIPGP
jgi:hypothetical protein